MENEISVIVPYYYGNKYIDRLFTSLTEQSVMFKNNFQKNIEVILVNDSPEDHILLNSDNYKEFNLKIINNDVNSGIQLSRINGLKHSTSPYIIFLDQDDLLINDAFSKLYFEMTKVKADVILGNGYFELNEKNNVIFTDKWSQDFATKESSYLLIRDFIVSPGQCLIKKSSIPNFWLENSLTDNGTDDYLLWLCMFNNNAIFKSCYDKLYVHKDTKSNLSSDTKKMQKSTNNMIQILEDSTFYNRKKLEKLKRTINFKRHYKKNFLNFITYSLMNLDLFIYNIYYRIRWRGFLIK